MKCKRFIGLIILLLCIVGITGQALADIHYFHYDANVSVARNKVAQYAYEILNYPWTTNATIARYKGNPNTTTGTIHGVPYANNMTFQAYKALEPSDKEKRNGNQMYYGMVCASFVTDCIRQGFLPTRLPFDGTCLFHKRTPEIYKRDYHYKMRGYDDDYYYDDRLLKLPFSL